MLKAQNRLLDDYDFRRVKRLGKTFVTPLFVLSFAPAKNPAGPPRFGFVFATTFDKRAVVRNRHKRILREAVRVNLNKFHAGFDIVIIPRRKLIGKTYEEICRIFDWTLPKTPLV
ncbi:ribonuclease P protein component [candidate division WWE3 bacterium CG08_land_8_20_14_0_20_40_13]|uniref:Ribonuclease P protein component n=1 Tax=candidate division WWE3 bacterium CG08_land_8_20_14_0_20_40_13 TaxID=1975084 RepID=A0A2H0XGG1_UNCKA|nr:MAG: ribonuclease P protein component [candidate division WWE3 bacterium CG08_land_8_20_14_0_20_40_13]